MIPIDKNVPLTRQKRERRPVAWRDMVPGDSVFVAADSPKQVATAHQTLRDAAKRAGLQVTLRRVEGGVRLWCLVAAPPEPTYSADECHVDFDKQEIVRPDGTFRLRGFEWTIFARLVKANGKVVHSERLEQLLWGHDPDGGPLTARKSLAVRISRVRVMSPWPIAAVADGYVMLGYKPAQDKGPKE